MNWTFYCFLMLSFTSFINHRGGEERREWEGHEEKEEQRLAWLANAPTPPELWCSVFLQHFQGMLLDLQPPPSWGLALLLDPEPSQWPCLDPSASGQCSVYPPSLSPSTFFLSIPTSLLSLSPSLLFLPLPPRRSQQIPRQCHQRLTQCEVLPWELLLSVSLIFFRKFKVSWHCF